MATTGNCIALYSDCPQSRESRCRCCLNINCLHNCKGCKGSSWLNRDSSAFKSKLHNTVCRISAYVKNLGLGGWSEVLVKLECQSVTVGNFTRSSFHNVHVVWKSNKKNHKSTDFKSSSHMVSNITFQIEKVIIMKPCPVSTTKSTVYGGQAGLHLVKTRGFWSQEM